MRKIYETPVMEIEAFVNENTMTVYASNIATNSTGAVTSLNDTLNSIDF